MGSSSSLLLPLFPSAHCLGRTSGERERGQARRQGLSFRKIAFFQRDPCPNLGGSDEQGCADNENKRETNGSTRNKREHEFSPRTLVGAKARYTVKRRPSREARSASPLQPSIMYKSVGSFVSVSLLACHANGSQSKGSWLQCTRSPRTFSGAKAAASRCTPLADMY